MVKKINNLEDLINHCAETLIELKQGKIEVEEACSVSELSKTMIAAVRAQLAYAHMIKEIPKIAFIGNCTQESIINIEKNSINKLIK